MTLTFDLLTLKVVSESRVTWAISMPILVFLGLSVLDFIGPMYDCTRQTDVRQTSDAHHRLMSPPGTLDGGGGIIIISAVVCLRAERSDWHRFLLSFQHSVPGCYDMFRTLILFLCECLSVCLSFTAYIALLWRINVFKCTVEIRCAGTSLWHCVDY